MRAISALLTALILAVTLTGCGDQQARDPASEPSTTTTQSKPPWSSSHGTDPHGRWADLKVGAVTQRMRWIAPGTFTMGTPTTETERFEDESPHAVTLTVGYWLADSECTQALWQAVTGENPSKFNHDRQRPVEQVSWDHAQGFLVKLNGQLRGGVFSLPTEAQWEYACRAGTNSAYAGDSLESLGWFAGNSDSQTHPVKQKSPNAWGLYDMHGNVWEWCLDWYGKYPSDPISDPVGSASGLRRDFRGGGWINAAKICRSAVRERDFPSNWNGGLGFRLCAQSAGTAAGNQTP